MLSLALVTWLAQAQVPDFIPPGASEPVPSEESVSPPPPPHSTAKPYVRPVSRWLWESAGAVGASAAGLGLALVFSSANQRIDATFATAMLSSLMISGVAMTIHQAMGGKGEVIFAFAGAALAMAGAAFGAIALDGTYPRTPILTSALGTVPAAALAVLALEWSSPAKRPLVALTPRPGGAVLTLTQAF